MKPYEITVDDVANFARWSVGDGVQDLDSGTVTEIQMALTAAKGYVEGYTGLSMDDCEFEDISYAILTICGEMLDNRQLTTQYTTQNSAVTTILNLHSTNLLPSVEV